MKILFLCHRFPVPADGGGKIRALHIVRHLARAGHEVTVCSMIRSEAEAEGVAELARDCHRVETVRVTEWRQNARMAARVFSGQPSTFGYFHSPALQARIDALLAAEPFDLILAHCSSMGPYVQGVTGIPKIIDFADMDSQKWLDYAPRKPLPFSRLYALEGRKVERQEAQLARAFDFCTTISAGELATLEGLNTGTPADWFPNGVDLDYFAPSGEAYAPDQIAFIGRMDYFPNAAAMQIFCRDVWPALRARRPGVRLKIIGAAPPRNVRRLERLDGVEVTGFVDDVRPHLGSAAVAIAPLTIARGMQNKVLECMAMGIPVVVSPPVARGLGLGEDSPLRIAATPDEYVERIVTILESRERRASLSADSRALVESRFSWGSALARLDSIIARCTAKPGAQGGGSAEIRAPRATASASGSGQSAARSAAASGPTA